MAIVSPSAEDDIDYLFGQVDTQTGKVDWVPTCGNILAGIGPFAIERGLVAVSGVSTTVRIRLVNTGARAVETVRTPNGQVSYDGDQKIAGVPGSAAPVQVTFTDLPEARRARCSLPATRPTSSTASRSAASTPVSALC